MTVRTFSLLKDKKRERKRTKISFVFSMHRLISERLHIVMVGEDQPRFERLPSFEYLSPMISPQKGIALEIYCGPPDLASLFDFCQDLENRLQSTDKMVALVTSTDGQYCTNTLFMLGAYFLLKLNQSLESTMRCLEPFLFNSSIHFWNASTCKAGIGLRIQDCLGALQNAKNLGWVDFSENPNRFDVEEYRELDSPLNADLHIIVPDKLIIMSSPSDLKDGLLWRDIPTQDGRFGRREFSPEHYADILTQLDVQAVVRCGEPTYDSRGFDSAGIAVVDLFWEDDAPPPVDVMSKFLALAERLPGALAVHSGVSGTLVGLYLMKHHGFTAREAVGWLQIVRPGW